MGGKILFCNIAYMKYYDSDVQEYDVPKNGGRYVNENNDALEKDNFHLCRDGYIRGYVETKYTDGYQIASKPKDLHIERIEKGSTDSVSGVTVIFCAKSDIVGKTVIVGWYKDAIVYRKRQMYKDRQYNIIARVEDCVRVEEADRHFIIPRSKGKDGVGFGQANVWYADKENAQELVGAVKTYIRDNSSDKISEYTVGEDKEEYSESGIGIKVVTNKYERNPNARKRCIELQGTTCKICGFDAARVYGEAFKGKIHVHHITPIHQIDTNYKVDPVKDLIPICPNCHMIIHTEVNGKCPTVEELQEIFRRK